MGLEKKVSASEFEAKVWSEQAYVCGIDEVGRGCFAGPVVTSAVILHPFAGHEFLKDSKILTETQRMIAADWIIKNSWYAYGIRSAFAIDTHNIYQATQQAMKQALCALYSQSSERAARLKLVLIDAMPLAVAYGNFEIMSFPFGESRSISIAAASILAKVKRDALLKRQAHDYPLYALDEHKGYGTKVHQEALRMHGPSFIHRATFIKGVMHDAATKPEQKKQQTTLFG